MFVIFESMLLYLHLLLRGWLHMFGCSNWEKYKMLLAESKAMKKEPLESTIVTSPRKRHRPRKRPGPNKQTNLSEDSQAEVQLKALKEIHNAQKTDPILTKQIAMDCEMVGIGDGNESMLARISIVNKYGVCLYDKYVKPTEEVKDYRSAVSGIYPHHLKEAEEFKTVQKEVAEMLKGRLLVGHALKNDLEVLYLSHPRYSQRDTSRYKPFRKIVNGNTPSLKKLAHELLGVKIQMGEHSSVEDARSAMQLYMLYRNKWEQEIRTKRR
ncbi:RNA exonuclease 4 isoform X2 [Belonocnema kinseyi]|uniref:RNA exonuclease 4 isoform X2 n=1 Tax=Belonocnema kinseyi TaxID=2817044 RepID=UPI00143D4FD9|nr:RNA exonuclease 4 isoform X2 [Belonocnema kinseyi]